MQETTTQVVYHCPTPELARAAFEKSRQMGGRATFPVQHYINLHSDQLCFQLKPFRYGDKDTAELLGFTIKTYE